jgi:hypothetical protein
MGTHRMRVAPDGQRRGREGGVALDRSGNKAIRLTNRLDMFDISTIVKTWKETPP